MFMVVTDKGVRVFDRVGQGLTEDDAEKNVAERNRRAKEMGLAVRYEIAPFRGTAKDPA